MKLVQGNHGTKHLAYPREQWGSYCDVGNNGMMKMIQQWCFVIDKFHPVPVVSNNSSLLKQHTIINP